MKNGRSKRELNDVRLCDIWTSADPRDAGPHKGLLVLRCNRETVTCRRLGGKLEGAIVGLQRARFNGWSTGYRLVKREAQDDDA